MIDSVNDYLRESGSKYRYYPHNKIEGTSTANSVITFHNSRSIVAPCYLNIIYKNNSNKIVRLYLRGGGEIEKIYLSTFIQFFQHISPKNNITFINITCRSGVDVTNPSILPLIKRQITDSTVIDERLVIVNKIKDEIKEIINRRDTLNIQIDNYYNQIINNIDKPLSQEKINENKNLINLIDNAQNNINHLYNQYKLKLKELQDKAIT